MQVAVGVEPTEIASGELTPRTGCEFRRRIAQVAEKGARRDQDLVALDADGHVRQRSSNAVAVVSRAVDADHRSALGQTVALVRRDAVRAGAG